MQIASGRHKREIYAWHHLIGRAPGFAGPLIGLRRSIGGAARVRMPCGKLLSEPGPRFSSQSNTTSTGYSYWLH